MRTLLNILVTALGFWAALELLPGMNLVGSADDFGRFLALLVISVIFGFINATVGTVLRLLSIPITCLTLGLFAIVVNAALLLLTAWVTSILPVSLEIDSFFWTAILATIIIAVVTSLAQWVLNMLLPARPADQR